MPGQSARHHLAAPSERRRYPPWYFLEQNATHLGERREVGRKEIRRTAAGLGVAEDASTSLLV
jgi:hypothetical protein